MNTLELFRKEGEGGRLNSICYDPDYDDLDDLASGRGPGAITSSRTASYSCRRVVLFEFHLHCLGQGRRRRWSQGREGGGQAKGEGGFFPQHHIICLNPKVATTHGRC